LYLHERWDAVATSATDERDARCLAQLGRNRETAESNNLSHVVIQHPIRDAYIEARHLAATTAKITVPVLSMTAFQDEAVTSRDGHYQDALDPQKIWIVQTNGGHDLYESRRFRDTLLAFFDHFVRGQTNGFETRPHAEIWFDSTSTGNGHDRQEAVTPGVVATFAQVRPPIRAARWWLADGQLLLPAVQANGRADAYQYPGHAPAVDAGDSPDLDRWGPLPVRWKAESLTYTTPPLDDRWVTYGAASADLWVSVNSTDADLQVTLTEVRPDGQEAFVQRGWLRLSDRATDPRQSIPLRPALVDRPETHQAMTPRQPALARIELPTFGHIFRRGSRIRIWIETPAPTGGYGFAPISAPTQVTLWHDAERPSRLVLGRLDSLVADTPRPRCGQVLKQPCRPDPLRNHLRRTHSS
jgi:putative CocE/NonD family hydrolase